MAFLMHRGRARNLDPKDVDSDDDGLFDSEEVNIYQTNPNNTDSDGDSYGDFEEVSNGYDPNGPGKLFEVPQE